MRVKRRGNAGDVIGNANDADGNTPVVSGVTAESNGNEGVIINAEPDAAEFAGIPVIDPSTGTGSTDSGTGTTGKRRGRPPGSRNTAGSKAGPQNLAAIESLLYSIHAMGAAFLRIPELELSKDESKMLADAVANVAKHYPVSVDPKLLAWGQLTMCCAGIYGPRIFARKIRASRQSAPLKVEPQSQPQPTSANSRGPIPVPNYRPDAPGEENGVTV